MSGHQASLPLPFLISRFPSSQQAEPQQSATQQHQRAGLRHRDARKARHSAALSARIGHMSDK